MAYEFRLPDIGEGLTEAEVVQWFVQVGEEVKLDQPLVQIETDKAVTEVPAPRAGVLLHQGAPAGARIEVGQVLAVIGERGEVWAGPGTPAPRGAAAVVESPALVGTLPEAPQAPEPAPGPAAAEPAAPTAAEPAAPTAAEPAAPPPGRPEALPAVRRLARELGVDLTTVRGTGPQGRITRTDVERAARAAAAGPAAPGQAAAPARAVPAQAAPARAVPGEPAPAEERVRMSRLRRTIAERLTRSWREIPHVTAFGQADAGRLLHAQKALATRRGERLPLETLFVRAVLPALQAHPQFNAAVEGEDLVLKRHYDIGIAVDTPEGLIVPVVRNADQLDLWSLAREVARLIEAARSRTATSEELTGPTFTISNIGAVGGSYGTPLIPWGTTAILSFGRVEEQAVVRGGRVEVAAMLPLSLSYDHRAIDGALGRRFLATVVEHLEEPALLVG